MQVVDECKKLEHRVLSMRLERNHPENCWVIIDIIVCLEYKSQKYRDTAPVAQLDRVPDYESVGRGSESLQAHQLNQWVMMIKS